MGGLPAQLGWTQKRGSLCTYPVSLFISFTFLICFSKHQRRYSLSPSYKILLHCSVCFPVLFLIHEHSKAKPSTKNRMLEVIACGRVLQTELLSNKVARNYLLLTGYCKHENNTNTSLMRRAFLKMLPASSMTTLSKLQETKNKVVNHPPLQNFFFTWSDHRIWTQSHEMMMTLSSHMPDS